MKKLQWRKVKELPSSSSDYIFDIIIDETSGEIRIGMTAVNSNEILIGLLVAEYPVWRRGGYSKDTDSESGEQIVSQATMDLNGCARANHRHQFGVADVKLRIIGPDREEYEGNPLYLHSEALQESSFFTSLISIRWCSNIRPLEIEVNTSQSFENYLKCIEMMYSSSVRFSDVDECLGILSVASELSVDKLLLDCMRYLEAVRWNSAQEFKIRNLMSSLNLSVCPDLNARLNKQSNNYLDFVRENTKAMISFLSNEDFADDKQPNIRKAVGKFIVDNLQGDASSGIADICRRIILEEFKANIAIVVSSNTRKDPASEERSYFVLLWLFTLIERCDGTIMEAALKILCKQVKPSDIREYSVKHRETMRPILLGFLEALANGKIIAERKLRVGFLTTWLPVMGQLIHSPVSGIDIKEDDALKPRLCRGVSNVLETLPIADWKGIYKIWIDCCAKNYIDMSLPFGWCCKLLQEPED